MDDGALSKIEKLIEEKGITPEDIIKARQSVSFEGLRTKLKDEYSCLDILKDCLTIAKPVLSEEFLKYLEPLEAVCKTGLSDSDILLSEISNRLPSLESYSFSERKPLASYLLALKKNAEYQIQGHQV